MAEIRFDKKRARLAARRALGEELFDLDLAKSDPEIWLHGTNLTAFEDTLAKQPYYPSSFIVDPYDPYEYASDDVDSSWYHDDDAEWVTGLHAGDYDAGDYDVRDYAYRPAVDAFDWGDDGWVSDPEPTDAAWRDLWVGGHVHDAEGRDLDGTAHDFWYVDDYDTYDLENPLLEQVEPQLPATIGVLEERRIERRRAGERYFKQTGRTVFKVSAVAT